jgi:hypothetical protein
VTPAPTVDLGPLISTIYEEFLAQYGDPELAAVATAAVVTDYLTNGRRDAEENYDVA